MRAQLTGTALLTALAIVAASCVVAPKDESGHDRDGGAGISEAASRVTVGVIDACEDDPDIGAAIGGDEPSSVRGEPPGGPDDPEGVEANQGRLFACRLVAKGPTQLRYAFCRTLRGAKAAACWRYSRSNETEWTNWCYAVFGSSCHE